MALKISAVNDHGTGLAVLELKEAVVELNLEKEKQVNQSMEAAMAMAMEQTGAATYQLIIKGSNRIDIEPTPLSKSLVINSADRSKD